MVRHELWSMYFETDTDDFEGMQKECCVDDYMFRKFDWWGKNEILWSLEAEDLRGMQQSSKI